MHGPVGRVVVAETRTPSPSAGPDASVWIGSNVGLARRPSSRTRYVRADNSLYRTSTSMSPRIVETRLSVAIQPGMTYAGVSESTIRETPSSVITASRSSRRFSYHDLVGTPGESVTIPGAHTRNDATNAAAIKMMTHRPTTERSNATTV